MNALEDDHYCFVCGRDNPNGLHCTFSILDGRAQARFVPQKIHQGYKDIVHGGILSTLLDEAMVKTALMQGIPVVTAEITVRFRSALMAGEEVTIDACVIKMNRKIIEASSSIRKMDGTLIAEGYAKLMRQGLSKDIL